jgi:hypothetical protein
VARTIQVQVSEASPTCDEKTDEMTRNEKQLLRIITREEVETRKIGRNETRTFQGLFPGCTRVSKKPGKSPT